MATVVIYGESSDGEVHVIDASIQTAREQAAGEGVAATNVPFGETNVIGSNYVYQGLVQFDCRGIEGTVSAVTLSLYGQFNNTDGTGTFDAKARRLDWGTSADTTDWKNHTAHSALTLAATFADCSANFSTAGYNDFTSDAGWPAALNKGGYERLSIKSSYSEAGGSANGPTSFGGTQNYVAAYGGEQTGTSQDPKLTVVTSDSYIAEVLTDSPLVYWPFAESGGTVAWDYSGNARHGTYQNTPETYNAGALRTGGQSVSFERGGNASTDDYASIADASWQSGFANLTIEAWVKGESAPGVSEFQTIVSKTNNSGANTSFNLDYRGGSGTKQIGFDVGTAAGVQGHWTWNVTLTVGTIYHVVVVHNGTFSQNAPRLYINGTDQGNAGSYSTNGSPSGNVYDDAYAVCVGAWGSDNAIDHWDGQISDVAIYSSALSSTRVTAHYNAGAGGGNTNVSPGGIASTAAFGSATISPGNANVSPGGIASTAALGTPSIATAQNVSPSGITSTAALGGPAISTTVNVSPGGISSTAVFGSVTLSLGGVNVSPSGIAGTSAFGSPTVNPGGVNLLPNGISSTAVMGSPAIAPTISISPSAIASTTAFGSAALTLGGVNVSPSGIASTAAVGTPVVSTGTSTIYPNGLASTAAFGSVTLTVGNVNVSPSGIAGTVVFGAPSVTRGNVNVNPTAISGSSVFGSPTVNPGNVQIVVSGIASTVAFGTPSIPGYGVALPPQRPTIGVGI